MKNLEIYLRELCVGRGLELVDRGNGHYQITGGPLLVNYYPLSKKKSAYVAGTTCRRVGVGPKEAVEMAFHPPSIVPRSLKDKRGGNTRPIKLKLLRKSNLCHWCKTLLTIETATLEHIIPLHRGGLDNANNRTLACEPCNRTRGHEMPELVGKAANS